jgi:hypothetical protein
VKETNRRQNTTGTSGSWILETDADDLTDISRHIDAIKYAALQNLLRAECECRTVSLHVSLRRTCGESATGVYAMSGSVPWCRSCCNNDRAHSSMPFLSHHRRRYLVRRREHMAANYDSVRVLQSIADDQPLLNKIRQRFLCEC